MGQQVRPPPSPLPPPTHPVALLVPSGASDERNRHSAQLCIDQHVIVDAHLQAERSGPSTEGQVRGEGEGRRKGGKQVPPGVRSSAWGKC